MRGVRVPDAPSLYAVIRLFSWSDYRIPKTLVTFSIVKNRENDERACRAHGSWRGLNTRGGEAICGKLQRPPRRGQIGWVIWSIVWATDDDSTVAHTENEELPKDSLGVANIGNLLTYSAPAREGSCGRGVGRWGLHRQRVTETPNHKSLISWKHAICGS